MKIVIGFGGNLGDPPAAFRAAAAGLASSHRVLASSRLYRTRSVGPSQPDFVNAALLLSSSVGAARLLAECRHLETAAGRDRAGERFWGPRPLDLDLLVALDMVHRAPQLEVPHRRLHERAFALLPTAELVADWIHPLIGRSIGDLADEASRRDPDAVIAVEKW